MISQILFITIAIISAYLIGAFPSAYIAGRLRKGIDIREVGSRNVGAMNVFYRVGFAEGILVLAVDIGKGAAAVALARWLDVPIVVQLFAGLAAVIGHSFPVFLKIIKGTTQIKKHFLFIPKQESPKDVIIETLCLLIFLF